ncbi:unnamed protein product [Leptidea sinapis]|uniref:Cation/H+ exchanger transmembrane domain-containing protein n=1 Tax=Leptidea sinapis TaxID=189913 RepID=A0A5E4PKL3_9NEOP|nr:unnamed protein product [Leptidea sinapis]
MSKIYIFYVLFTIFIIHVKTKETQPSNDSRSDSKIVTKSSSLSTIESDINVTHGNMDHDGKIVFIDPKRPSLGYPTSLQFLFVFTTLLVGVIVRVIMLATSMCIPYRVVMFAIGGCLGFLAHTYQGFKPFVNVCYIDVDSLLTLFLPILVFYTSYTVDSHSFWKNSLQILLVGVPGVLLTALIVAFMAYYLIESSWDFPTAVLFGVICSPIHPVDVVAQLRELTKGKYISVLLLGEGLIGDVTTMIVFVALYGYLAMAITEASQISLMLLRFAGGGALLGLLAGKIISLILSLTYNDILCSVTITLSGAYLTYYIGEKFFYVSGLLGTVIAGILVSKSKSTVAPEVEQAISSFWRILLHVANTLVFTMVGSVIFEKLCFVITVRQVALIFVTYSTVSCSRLLVYFVLTPILRRIGYGMSWQHALACVWGGIRGPLPLCLSLIVLQNPVVEDAGETFIIQTAGLVILSLLINATTYTKVLRILGLSEISLAKKANMTNCVKRIMSTRDRCISMLKMDKFLADANWDLVQSNTSIKHPYQIQMSGRDLDSDDDTYMGYREANQRVLKALKISYWRQYEHGKISKDGVRTLVQAVEVAADLDDGKINIEQLGTLWKPKAHAIWLRRKLVDMLTTDAANAQVPRDPHRQRWYRVVTNSWFDAFIYFAILCNTPVILCEVVLRGPVSTTVTYSIKMLNLLAVTRQLGLLQRDRPWTAITVKTRQATTSTLNIMMLDAVQLKEEGLYILVSGLCEATYKPPEEDIDEAIPNYEFLTDLKFSEPSQDFIVSGNALGVLGVLTNRPYSYTVRCDSAVQAYYITMHVMKEAFNLTPHPIMGLEASMWREIGIKLSLMVLPTVPAYHAWSAEKISMRLEHAFVPCLKAFKVFVVNELMEDIVLLDGVCQDMATREVFQPPCYIPRYLT